MTPFQKVSSLSNNKLNITEYPAHILVGRDGKIVKVVNKIEDIIPYINGGRSKELNFQHPYP